MSSKKFGYFSNLKYICSKQQKANKRYLWALLGDIPISLATSILIALLPKIVLDCIEKSCSNEKLLASVGLVGVILVILKILEKFLLSYENQCLDISKLDLYRKMLFHKIIDMDYNNYIYNETRILKEKAIQAIRSRMNGVAMFLLLNKNFFLSFLGFGTFATIIAQCNFWFIPIIIVCYALSSIGWLLLQKFNDSIKNKRAKVFMQLDYVTFRSKDFSDAKDIRVYNMADYMMGKINRHLKENTKFDTKKNNIHFVNVLFEDILSFIVSLGAYFYLIYLKFTTDMTVGDFALYFGAITGFSAWLGGVVDSIVNLIECNHNVNDYRNFLAIPDKMNLELGCSLPKPSELPCSIDIENLKFTYDKNESPVIDGLSLSIKAGEKLAIVGLNGAGKSTLVKIISGLFLPQSGKIYINKKDIKKYNRDEYYRLFTTIFQDASLLPSTIAKNIALCEEKDIDIKRLNECIELAGLTDKINALPEKENTLLVREINDKATALSGGELQKLLLARALYKNAPIIILDEPTAALDPIAESNMYQKYNQLVEGKTSIYISHRLSSTRFCDRIILLDNANIVEMGTHDELIALNGKYAEMFEIQSKYYRRELFYEENRRISR